MKSIEKISLWLTRICEAGYWVMAALMLVCFFLTLPLLISGDPAAGYAAGFAADYMEESYTLNGIELVLIGPDGAFRWGLLRTLILGEAAICGLTAMIFRRAHQIVRQSRTASPFCRENLPRLKQIGLLAIAMPVVKVLLSLLPCLTGGVPIEVSLHMGELCIGLMVLCLTRYFAQGAALEQDVEGLV